MSSSSPSLVTNATSTSSPMSSAPAKKSVLNLPPGYHFLPTDDELVVHYLRPKLANANHRLPLPIFVNERILEYHPDQLIEKYRGYGEGRWFFFTKRERKHTAGNRPNRTTPDKGHWNATGSIRPIRSAGGVLVGCRRTLVFYEASRSRKKKNQLAAGGLPPTELDEAEEGDGNEGQVAAAKAKDGVKTEWTMYEYQSLTSEAEFEALRNGNADKKMDELVLCTIQKKKNSQEGGETKKSTKRKTKEESLELEAAGGGGNVEQGSHVGTTEGQDEDHVAPMEAAAAAAAAEPQEELAYQYHYHAPDAAGVDNFNVDPDQPYYFLTNSLSTVPTPSQNMLMAPAASGDNQIVMNQQNYFFINQSMMNMKNNSQSFHVQETPPQEFLPYLDTQQMMTGPPPGGFGNMLQNRFINMTPSQQAPHPVPGTGMYPSPSLRSKSDVWDERSADQLPGDKPNLPLKSEDDDWWISRYCQAPKLPGRELINRTYAPNSLSFVPTPHQQETATAFAAREYNHTVMHQQNYVNHSMNMRNPQFHVQAILPQEEFLPYSRTKNIMDHHMLQNRIVNMTPASEAHTFNGYSPGLANSNSNYGHGGGDYTHLSAMMDHPGPSRFSFPSQQSQGLLLNNQVSLINNQNSAAAAASMVGYDQMRNGVGSAPKIV